MHGEVTSVCLMHRIDDVAPGGRVDDVAPGGRAAGQIQVPFGKLQPSANAPRVRRLPLQEAQRHPVAPRRTDALSPPAEAFPGPGDNDLAVAETQ